MPPKAMELLVLLVGSRGRIVEKAEIQTALWPGVVVEEGNLTQTVFLLRKALEDSTEHPAYVVTVPRRGYRFEAPASPVAVVPRKRSSRVRAVAAALVFAVAAGVWAYWARSSTPPEPSRLVVLPFVNMSADPDTEYFSDGLTEELINALTRVEGLRVVARTTAFQFKGKSKDVREIGKQLNVDTVLKGSVRKQGNQLRVTAQLNNAANGYHHWSETFDREPKHAIEVQEEIAHRVAVALGKGGNRSRTRVRGRNLEAHDLYLRGLHERRKVFGVGLERAIGYFESAIRKDTDFAEAHAALALALGQMSARGKWPSERAFPRALKQLKRALEIDPNLSTAHMALGWIHMSFNWDWKGAEYELLKAIELNPFDGEAHHQYSHILTILGRREDALRESIRAREFEPLDMIIAAHRSWHHNMWGEYAESIAAAKSALEIDPSHNGPRIYMRSALDQLGRLDEAVSLESHMGYSVEEAAKLQTAYREGGERAYRTAKLEYDLLRNRNGSFNPANIAKDYARLGQRELALRWLRTAVEQREPEVVNMRRDPGFTALRRDLEFQAIANRMGLP